MARPQERTRIMKNLTTYPKAKLAEIKKRGGFWLAKDIMTEINFSSGLYYSRDRAGYFASLKIEAMTARQVTQFLKDNGYKFNSACANWQAPEVPDNQ